MVHVRNIHHVVSFVNCISEDYEIFAKVFFFIEEDEKARDRTD